jgi:hypothetical protein
LFWLYRLDHLQVVLMKVIKAARTGHFYFCVFGLEFGETSKTLENNGRGQALRLMILLGILEPDSPRTLATILGRNHR